MIHVGILTIALLGPSLTPTGGEARGAQSAIAFDDEMKGKAVTVITRSNPRVSAELEKIQMRKIEGKSFLVGVGADTPNNWQKGIQVWVAVDDISMLNVYDSIEALRRH